MYEKCSTKSGFVFTKPNMQGRQKLGFPMQPGDAVPRLEGTYRLEFDWQGTPAEGAIQVQWTPLITVETHKEDMDAIEFTFTAL